MSLDMVIAFLGGYINVIYMVFFVLTFVYRNFTMDMSFVKRMYTVDGRE